MARPRLFQRPRRGGADIFVDADELPMMPHIEPAKALRFGIGKLKELLARNA